MATVAAPAICIHCSRSMDLVRGDGPRVVCRPCIRKQGGAAQDPTSIDIVLLRQLRRRHRAVVALMEAATGHPAWSWIAEWPGVKA